MDEPKHTVLIAGASSGTGANLAREFARHGHSLLLVARDGRELERTAAQIRQESVVQIHTITCDLRDADAIDDLVADVEAAGFEIDILCNAAGVGLRGKFWQTAENDHLDVLRLNIEALTRLTYAFLPAMLQRGRGRILNVSSVPGFQPGPDMAVYRASQAYVRSLSESLATELRSTPVTLTTLSMSLEDAAPNPISTSTGPAAPQELVPNASSPMVAAAYKSLMAGDRSVSLDALNPSNDFSRRFSPEDAHADEDATLPQPADPELDKNESAGTDPSGETSRPFSA